LRATTKAAAGLHAGSKSHKPVSGNASSSNGRSCRVWRTAFVTRPARSQRSGWTSSASCSALLVNAFKLVTANAERMLALSFNRVYKCSKDAFSIFRGLLQLPGIVRPIDPDRVEVVLERPDSDKVATALQELLTELTTQHSRRLGTGPILTFRLADINLLEALT
jgi:hypothetical protein